MRFPTILLLLLVLRPASADSLLSEIVVSATRSEQALQHTASNIGAVSQSDLVRIRHTHINEAMHRVAGAWISRGNGQESLTAIRSPVLTGAGGCGAFLMLQDSIPLQAPGFCNVNELFGSHSEVASAIEVIKGPGTAFHGSNAMHGLVNVVTPKVSAIEQIVQVEMGPHEYFRARYSQGQQDWRLDTSATTDNGYKKDSGFRQQKLTAKASSELMGLPTSYSFSFTNLSQETAGFIQGFEAYRDSALRKENPNPEAFRDVTTVRGSLQLRHDNDSRTLVLTPYFRYIDMQFLQHFLPGQPLEKNNHASLGIQSTWRASGPWLAGMDVDVTRASLDEHQPEITSGSEFLVETIPQGQHYDYDVSALTVSGFIQYTANISDQSAVVLGLRADFQDFEYDNRMLDGRTREDGSDCGFGGCRFSRPADRSDSFTNLSPKLGFLHSLNSEHQFYALLARGFRAPQATELYRLQGAQNVSSIDSETLNSIEMGWRGGGTVWQYDFSLYAMNKDNFIFRDTNRMNVDNGKTSHRGAELTLSVDIGDRVTSNLHASYAVHKYANNPTLVSSPVEGNVIDTAPELMGSINMNWQLTPDLDAELEWIVLDDYYTDPQNTASYEGHDLLNLRVDYRPDKSWTFFLRVMNIADRDYAERADFGFGNHRYFVGEPRSIYVGLRRHR